MTVQEEVKQRIARDVLLVMLRKKIDSGKADFNDTFLYSDRAGKLLGEIFSRRLPDIPIAEREALCVELLRDRYTDINALCDAVQRVLDKANGLHLKPQRAPFEKARAHLIGHSTADQTVSVETQQRRGRSATATMTRSMHDDRMKAEAKFRSGAGLQCYITRKTDGKCCEWCSAIAGRYEYHSEPKDVYRRHDNCSCTVTYENGRKRQDVWSKREWEAPEEDAGAPEPTKLTAEQAAELEAQHSVIAFTPGQVRELEENALMGLTIGANRSIISAITIDDFKAADKGGEIDSACFDTILGAIKTARGRGFFIFDSVSVVDIPDKPNGGTDVMRTNVYNQAGNPFVVLELNHAVFAGCSKEEIDDIFLHADNTACKSLEEAAWHECGHARTAFGRTYASYERVNETLSREYFTKQLSTRDDKKSLRDLAGSVSKLAQKDGLECIAECEVILERGETLDADLQAFYDLFTTGGG